MIRHPKSTGASGPMMSKIVLNIYIVSGVLTTCIQGKRFPIQSDKQVTKLETSVFFFFFFFFPLANSSSNFLQLVNHKPLLLSESRVPSTRDPSHQKKFHTELRILDQHPACKGTIFQKHGSFSETYLSRLATMKSDFPRIL
jgi:hypothetical protein